MGVNDPDEQYAGNFGKKKGRSKKKSKAQKKALKERKELCEAGKARDEGGPSRQFYSTLFGAICDLKVPLKLSEGDQAYLSLFEEVGSGIKCYYDPISDEKIDHVIENTVNERNEKSKLEYHPDEIENEKQNLKKKIGKYYTAVGRIFLHAMLDDQKIVCTSMSALLRNGNYFFLFKMYLLIFRLF